MLARSVLKEFSTLLHSEIKVKTTRFPAPFQEFIDTIKDHESTIMHCQDAGKENLPNIWTMASALIIHFFQNLDTLILIYHSYALTGGEN